MTTDAALVSRTQAGDEEAFRALYERHRPAVERVCRNWLRDPYLVEDAVQATFLKAWTALEAFEGGAEVDRWLRRIAKNHCHDVWRNFTRAERLGRPEDPSAEQADPASMRLAGECVDRLAVETMLRNLGRRDASLLVQRHIGEYPVGTLAAEWGLTKGAMDVALHRARLRARRLASAEGLRGVLPVGVFRRVMTAIQRMSTSHGDAGLILMGVCNIAVAVSLAVPDVPPAYADEQASYAPSAPAPTSSLPVQSLAIADRVPNAAPATPPVRRPQVADRRAASPAADLSITRSRSLEGDGAAPGEHRPKSYVEFERVTLPAGGASLGSKPRGERVRSVGIRPASVEVEENNHPSVSDPAKPAYDAACTLAEVGDPVTYCEDNN